MKKVFLTIVLFLSFTASAGAPQWARQIAFAQKGGCTAIAWQNERGDIMKQIKCDDGELKRAIYFANGSTAFNLSGEVGFYK